MGAAWGTVVVDRSPPDLETQRGAISIDGDHHAKAAVAGKCALVPQLWGGPRRGPRPEGVAAGKKRLPVDGEGDAGCGGAVSVTTAERFVPIQEQRCNQQHPHHPSHHENLR